MQMTETQQENVALQNCCERVLRPRTDIAEYGDRFEITMELPGVAVEKVGLQIENDELRISAERETAATSDNGHQILVRERRRGTFARTFQLGPAIDRDRIEGQMADGVLRIRLPKSAAVLPRKIQVNG